jgi:hypothetical protein
MADNKDLTVDGFEFATPEDAKIAQSEKLRIEKIELKLDYSDTAMVNAVLQKAIETRVFKTPLGYEFMHRLQNVVKDNPPEGEEIPDIPVYGAFSLRDNTPIVEKKVEPSKKKPEKPKPKEFYSRRTSIIINVLLLVLVCAMFVITMYGESPNILNYERALQNRYSQWEEELSDREAVIREKEKELLINE